MMVLMNTEECFPLAKKIGVSNLLFAHIELHVHQHQTGCPSASNWPYITALSLHQHRTVFLSASNWPFIKIKLVDKQHQTLGTAAKLAIISIKLDVQQRRFGRSAVSNWLVITATHKYVLSHVVNSMKPLGLDTNVTTNLSQHKLLQFSLLCHRYVLCYNVWYTN